MVLNNDEITHEESGVEEIWELLNQNYEGIEAVRRINAIDVSGLPAVSRLVNHYVHLRLGYDPLSKVD